VRLDVPYRTQLDGSLSALSNCGPTSVAMILEGFGIRLPTAGARALALRQMGISSAFSGTTLESLRSVARRTVWLESACTSMVGTGTGRSTTSAVTCGPANR
jgi:hypothetical protein